MENLYFDLLTPEPPFISFGEQKNLPLTLALQIFSYADLPTLHQWQRVSKNWRASLYSFAMMESMALHCLVKSIPRWILIPPNIVISSKYQDFPSYDDFKKATENSMVENKDKEEAEENLQHSEEAEQIQATVREWKAQRLPSTTVYDFSLIYQGLMSNNVMTYPLKLDPKEPEMKVTWQENLQLKHRRFATGKLELTGGQSFKIKAVFEKVHPQHFYQILKNLKKSGNANSFKLLLRLYKLKLLKAPKASHYQDALNKAIDYLNHKNRLKSEKEDQHLASQHVRFAKAITAIED
jgi:hypothetical protein